MPAGRKPKPQAVHDLNGNPGKRARRKDQPTPTAGVPECPPHLGEAARAEWDRITAQLSVMGVLTHADRAALAVMCDAYGRWVEASAMVEATGGMVVKTTNGNVQQNPFLSIANRAQEQMLKVAVEFGLTPSSRTRIGTGNQAPAADPDDDFFTGPRLAE